MKQILTIKPIYFKIIILILIITAILSYMISQNILTPGFIFQGDFVQAYYEMFTIRYDFLENNQVPFGFSNDFYAGYFGFPFFTPGLSIYGVFFWILGIEPDYYFRIIIISVFICAFLLAIKIIDEFKLKGFNKILGIILIFGSSGLTFFFRTGVPHDNVGICLGVGFSIVLNKMLVNLRENKKNPPYFYPLSILLLQFLLIIHSIFIILSAFIIMSHLLIFLIQFNQARRTNNRDECIKLRKFFKSGIYTLILIFGINLITNSFWLINLLPNFNYAALPEASLNFYSANNSFYSKIWFFRWLQEFPLILVPFLIIGFYSVFKERNNLFLITLCMAIIAILGILFVTSIFIPDLQMSLGRSCYVLDYLMPGVILKGVSYAFMRIKGLKGLNLKKALYTMVISYIILFGMFGFVFRLNDQHDFQNVNDDTFNIFDWINNNTTNKSRVLLEDSVFSREQIWGNGRIVSLAPIYTNRTYIGGYHSVYYLYQSQIANFYAGFIFNNDIENISYYDFTRNLKMYNIEYIVSWSEESLKYFNENATEFLPITSFGSFTIYRFQNASSSFCLDENYQPILNEIIEFNSNNRTFKIKNVLEDQKIILSFSDCNKLTLYVNNTKVEKVDERTLVSFNAPFSGDLIVELVWENYIGEDYLFYIFILNHPILITILVYFLIVNKKAHKARINKIEPEGGKDL